MIGLSQLIRRIQKGPARGRPQRVLAILGMHRSGTSCLTGTLQQAGLVLGKVHTANKYNLKGNRENLDVVDLHQALLRDNGGRWDSPPDSVEWKNRHRRIARRILADFAGLPIWGFKDPRTLLFLDGWLDLVPDMEFVGIFRHPMLVARSLASRKELPVSIEAGLMAWAAYNQRMLALYRNTPFPLLSFDWPEDAFHEKTDRVVADLKLETVPGSQRFYTRELHKQHLSGDETLPADIRGLYEQLQAAAGQDVPAHRGG